MEREKAPETSTFAELQAVNTRSEHLGLRKGGRRVAGGAQEPALAPPRTWPYPAPHLAPSPRVVPSQ